jgi:hypothetical protein
VIHRGRVTAIRRKHDNSALLRLLRRTEAHTARNGRGGAAKDHELSQNPRFDVPAPRCPISLPALPAPHTPAPRPPLRR